MGSMQNREVSPTGLDPDISKNEDSSTHLFFLVNSNMYIKSGTVGLEVHLRSTGNASHA